MISIAIFTENSNCVSLLHILFPCDFVVIWIIQRVLVDLSTIENPILYVLIDRSPLISVADVLESVIFKKLSMYEQHETLGWEWER